MPTYIYKAVDKRGHVVTNKVEAFSEYLLLKKLKDNGLFPIKVKSLSYQRKGKFNGQRKNTETSGSILREMRIRDIETNKAKKKKDSVLSKNVQIGREKIRERDILIFTQNFYLLKKANFNNVHALSTIIEATENKSLKDVLEDILLRSRSWWLYACHNGVLSRCFFTDIC